MRYLLSLILLSTMGCARFTLKNDEASAKVTSTQTVKMNWFLWGFVANHQLPTAAELCPSGSLGQVKAGMNAGDVALTVITLGIYVPYHNEITCLDKSSL